MWVEGRWVKFYVEEMQKIPSVARIFFPRERNSKVYLSFLLRPQQQTEVWVHHGSFWEIHAFASFLRWGVTYRNVNVSSRKDTLHRLHWVGRWLSHSHTDGAPLTCSVSIYSSPFPRPHAIRAELHTVDGPEQLNIRPGSHLYSLRAPSPWLLCGFSCSHVTWLWKVPAQQATLCAGFLALGLLSSILPVCPVTNHRNQ